MKDFFKGVRKHIDRLDAGHLREQYKLVADELANTEMFLHTLKEGFVRLDPDGRILQFNPAAKRLLGSEPADALADLGLPLGKSSNREVEVSYPEDRILEIQTIPLGKETIVYIRDITAEKKRTEEELRAGATKAISGFAAGLAHEIGNPLNALALSLQLVKRDPMDTAAIDTGLAQLKRLDGIIRDFLSAIRPRKPNLMPGSVADPLKDCLAMLKPQFEERRIAVTLDIPAALPNVALDAEQMEQVFFNLLKNALEAMKDGGTIVLTLGSDDKDVFLSIRDNGIGMDAEQLVNLFEPYRTTKEKGTGLGLMISKRIITEHGGSIAAESKPGDGTTFTITLPRLERRIRALK